MEGRGGGVLEKNPTATVATGSLTSLSSTGYDKGVVGAAGSEAASDVGVVVVAEGVAVGSEEEYVCHRNQLHSFSTLNT